VVSEALLCNQESVLCHRQKRYPFLLLHIPCVPQALADNPLPDICQSMGRYPTKRAGNIPVYH
jgi:hypothetical protein